MKRIDLMGVPGVGKSTLYKKLIKCRNKNFKFLTLEEAKFLIARKHSTKAKKTMKDSLKDFLLITRVYKITTPDLPDIVLRKKKREFLWDSKEKMDDFIDKSIKLIEESDRISLLKLYDFSYFCESLENVLLLKKSTDEATVLIDESLAKRPFLSHRDDKEYLDRISEYFYNMPIPDGIVFFRSSTSEVLARIEERKKKQGKIIPGHKDLSKDELRKHVKAQIHVSEYGLTILRKRNIPILILDASNPIKTNSEKVISFIKEMEGE